MSTDLVKETTNGVGAVGEPIPRDEISLLADTLEEELSIPPNGIKNLEKTILTDGPLVVTVTLCPLYGQDGQLIGPESGLGILDSRVGIKWAESEKTFRILADFCERNGHGMEPRLTFADRGIIVDTEPESEDEILSALQYQLSLYQEAADALFNTATHIEIYSEIDPNFDLFLTAGPSPFSDKDEAIIAFLQEIAAGEYLTPEFIAGKMINPETERPYNRMRKRVTGLINNYGFRLALGLTRQYLNYDSRTTAEGALNLYFERNVVLLLLNSFDPFSPQARDPRIEVLCSKQE